MLPNLYAVVLKWISFKYMIYFNIFNNCDLVIFFFTWHCPQGAFSVQITLPPVFKIGSYLQFSCTNMYPRDKHHTWLFFLVMKQNCDHLNFRLEFVLPVRMFEVKSVWNIGGFWQNLQIQGVFGAETEFCKVTPEKKRQFPGFISERHLACLIFSLRKLPR